MDGQRDDLCGYAKTKEHDRPRREVGLYNLIRVILESTVPILQPCPSSIVTVVLCLNAPCFEGWRGPCPPYLLDLGRWRNKLSSDSRKGVAAALLLEPLRRIECCEGIGKFNVG